MKKIHRQIIAKQAQCLDKALKRIKLKQSLNHYRREYPELGLKWMKDNNSVFSNSLDLCRAMKSTKKAEIIRKLFITEDFKHHRNSVKRGKHLGKTLALRKYSQTFVFKFFLTESILGTEGNSINRTFGSAAIQLAKKIIQR